MKDEQNPKVALQALSTDLLLAASQGLVNLQALARHELLSRNVSLSGVPIEGGHRGLAYSQLGALYAEAVPNEAAFERFMASRNRGEHLRRKS